MSHPGTFDTRGDRATTKRPAARPRYRAPDAVTKRSTIQVRVGPADLARLDAIAATLQISKSAVIRRAIECWAAECERFRYVNFAGPGEPRR